VMFYFADYADKYNGRPWRFAVTVSNKLVT
jgi:hypothetical protein